MSKRNGTSIPNTIFLFDLGWKLEGYKMREECLVENEKGVERNDGPDNYLSKPTITQSLQIREKIGVKIGAKIGAAVCTTMPSFFILCIFFFFFYFFLYYNSVFFFSRSSFLFSIVLVFLFYKKKVLGVIF